MSIRDIRILECFYETADPNAVKRRLGDLEDAIDALTQLCARAANITTLRKEWPDFKRCAKKLYQLAVDAQPVRK